MKKSTKVWLGIATVWPIAWMVLFMAFIVVMFSWTGINNGPGPHPPPGGFLFPLGFMSFFLVHMITVMGSLALTVFYVIRVFKTERIDQNLKIMWTLLMFFAGMFAQPVFWYLYIWREPETTPASPSLMGPGFQTSWTKANATEREPAYVPPPQPPDWR
jgi:hypothetical protein